MAQPWHPGGTNPVLPGFHPDPSVCRVGEWVYLVTSTFEYLPGLPIHRSRDMVSWEFVGHVVDRDGMLDMSGVRDSGGLYAPTIRHDGERFYVVCTQVDGDGPHGNFVCVADDPAGPWSDPVWWDDTQGIDPSLFFDGDEAWCLGTRPVEVDPEWDEQTEVWLRRFDRDSLLPVGDETIIWTGAVRGAVWAEGPHLFRTEAGVMLLAAEGGTERHHAVCVAIADRAEGPYQGNKANPVLTHRHLGAGMPVTNVGHADLVDLADGTTWGVCLASRPINGADLMGRETFLVPVIWEDGWPVFAPGVGMLEVDPATPGVEAPERVRSFADDLTAPLDGRWAAPRALPAAVGSTTPEGLAFDAPGAVLHRIDAVPCELSVTARGAGGLLLRYSDADQVRVDLADGAVAVTSVAGGEATLLASAPAGDSARLSVRLAGTEAAVAVDGQPLATASTAHLCAAASGGFVGLMAGPAAAAPGAVLTTYAYAADAPARPRGENR